MPRNRRRKKPHRQAAATRADLNRHVKSLGLRNADDTQIAKLSAVAPVGEMGIFTDEPRSATVVAITDSTLFVLEKYQLKNAMRQNKDVEIIISRNVIATLAQRIRESNEELNHLRR